MSTSFFERVTERGQQRLPASLRDRDWLAFVLVAPGIVLFLSFMLFPIAFLIYLSFTDATHTGTVIGGEANFIGFDNYISLFTDSQFWNSLGVTWLFLTVSVVAKIIVGIAIAMILTHARVRGKRYMRALVIVPLGFPEIFSITVWRGMFSSARFGPFNEILSMYNSAVTSLVGVIDSVIFFAAVSAPEFLLADVPIAWFGSRWSTFASYVTTEVWLAYPFMVIIIVSALQDVPKELHDAAKVDGAGYFHRFRHVTLPAIKRPTMFASILTAAASFQQFLVPWVFNRGGPARDNELILVYGFREAIELNEYALSSAIMVTALAFVGMFMWLAVKKGDLADGVGNDD
ncbi:carbohydrate ABC transporter permease [Halobiforma nitratireducens]|uniref:Binding-protein-dependent transport system inner membrane protein n=1 Tax=Halobiforma nitratireducens JCM 10879 TaxID=1227454 RepID=M0MF89_9EURY|nr:sugar ABC transporter permease [Halobiforma nitratireducens]EMA43075.1 binding-protein-dependent transport system inner membrane protein [Halobiforma nitratireducens JCM 10879]